MNARVHSKRTYKKKKSQKNVRNGAISNTIQIIEQSSFAEAIFAFQIKSIFALIFAYDYEIYTIRKTVLKKDKNRKMLLSYIHIA